MIFTGTGCLQYSLGVDKEDERIFAALAGFEIFSDWNSEDRAGQEEEATAELIISDLFNDL